jgi:large subunit ribosomal protein L13
MKTHIPKVDHDKKDWFVVDASGATLGKLAAKVASVLRGKHRPDYTPSIDTGDFVVVINADKISVTGKKLKDKIYRHHTTYPSGLREIALQDLIAKKPEEAVKQAVEGMLPNGSLGRAMFKKLKVYGGAEHPHDAQKPRALAV